VIPSRNKAIRTIVNAVLNTMCSSQKEKLINSISLPHLTNNFNY